jgi:hypothetical protein
MKISEHSRRMEEDVDYKAGYNLVTNDCHGEFEDKTLYELRRIAEKVEPATKSDNPMKRSFYEGAIKGLADLAAEKERIA